MNVRMIVEKACKIVKYDRVIVYIRIETAPHVHDFKTSQSATLAVTIADILAS